MKFCRFFITRREGLTLAAELEKVTIGFLQGRKVLGDQTADRWTH